MLSVDLLQVEQVQEKNKKFPVLVYSKTWCPYCAQVALHIIVHYLCPGYMLCIALALLQAVELVLLHTWLCIAFSASRMSADMQAMQDQILHKPTLDCHY